MEIIRENVAQQRNIKKDLLKKELEQLRLDAPVTRENGIHPIQIFPEELWLQILKNVTEVEDITNCSRANVFFHKTLNASKPELLFSKVCPIFLHKLTKDEVLVCRRVCKSWRFGVDSFLENCVDYAAVEEETTLTQPFTGSGRGNLKYIFSFNFCYRFGIGIGNQAAHWQRYHDKFRNEMKKHSKNPFVSRTVEINIFGENFQNDLDEIVNDFGNHIWTLRVTKAAEYDILADVFYSMCRSILVKCPYLQSLELTDVIDLTSNPLSVTEPLPDHRHLKTLILAKPYPDAQFMLSNDTIAVQDLLIKKYSNQLKYLELTKWNSMVYHNLDWNNLKSLHVSDTSKWLLQHSGEQLIKTSDLLEIAIKFDYSGAEVKEAIREINNNFPKLERLVLNFAGVTCLTSDEILTLNVNNEISCNASVTWLVLSDVQKYSISYDILVFFPRLRRLQLNYNAEVNFEGNNQNSDGVQIDKFVLENGAGDVDKASTEIYKSNVWKVLPYLKFLKVVKETEDEEGAITLSTVTYSRDVYDHIMMSASFLTDNRQ